MMRNQFKVLVLLELYNLELFLKKIDLIHILKMKKYVWLLGIFIFSANLFSQTDSTKIAFISYWSVGDSYDFKISKASRTWENDTLTEKNFEEYIANFTVIDSTENSYTIQWSYKVDLINTYEFSEEVVEAISNYDINKIIYKTSEYGEFIEILNWQEIARTINAMYDEIMQIYTDKEMPAELADFINLYRDIYSSQQGIEEILMGEIKIIHFPLGYEFQTDKVLKYKDYLPNFFADEPLEADAQVSFQSVDFEHNFCVMKHELSINPMATRKMLDEMKNQLQRFNLYENEMDVDIDAGNYAVNDTNIFEYYYYPGIPHKIDRNREILIEIGVEKIRTQETLIMELIYL